MNFLNALFLCILVTEVERSHREHESSRVWKNIFFANHAVLMIHFSKIIAASTVNIEN